MGLIAKGTAALSGRAGPTATPGAAKAAADSDGYIPFKARFKAWWDGDDPGLLTRSSDDTERGVRLVVDEPDEGPKEPIETRLLREVWGAGHARPGGDEFDVDLVKPVGLTGEDSALELGAGLGGGARAIAKATEVWISGLERSESLAEAGMALSEMAGLGKRAPVSVYSPENIELPAQKYDCVFSRECLYQIIDKDRMFGQIRDSMKRKAHLILTDIVLTSGETDAPEVREWMNVEPVPPAPWTLDRYRAACSELNLEVQIFQDQTETYCAMVRKAWADFMDRMDPQTLDRDYVNLMLKEAERWQKRVCALESGEIGILRVHAILRPAATMSDW